MSKESNAILDLITGREAQMHTGWLAAATTDGYRGGSTDRGDALGLMQTTRDALRDGADPAQFEHKDWQHARTWLEGLSRSSAAQGRSAAETSQFVLSLKRPMFDALQQDHAADPRLMLAAVWMLSALVDQMAAWTVNTWQRSREDLIHRQQAELLELSTPVIKLWEGVLAVPMIGTLDSARTQVVMESLLERIANTGAHTAIIDITGVPTVDTLVARHLLQTVAAVRLMGAECIISGIRPQIAQTVVHLGIDLTGVLTRGSLADALQDAMKRGGYSVSR
jgi:rsbT co-antagonist protein RsbR